MDVPSLQKASPMAGPDANIDTALKAISALDGVRIAAVSPSYYTEPQGMREQAWFANRVARLECDHTLEPHALLSLLLHIETVMGRCRSEDPALRFGPRVIDIDILLFQDNVIDSPDLIVPHPRMTQRAFVLIPLRDVIVPMEKSTAADISLFSETRIDDILSRLPYRLEGSKIWQ